MSVPLGLYRSPGALRRSLTFERRRAEALQIATPLTIQAALARFREVEQELQPQARPTIPPEARPTLEDVRAHRGEDIRPLGTRLLETGGRTIEQALTPFAQSLNRIENTRLVEEAGLRMSDDEKDRLQFLSPDVVRQAIKEGNIGPLVDIGSPGSLSPFQGIPILGTATQREEPLPGLGKIPFFRTPAEIAATVATAGAIIPALGLRGAVATTAAASAGALAGGEVAEEVGAPPIAGELLGALATGGAIANVAVRLRPQAVPPAVQLINEEIALARSTANAVRGINPELAQSLDRQIVLMRGLISEVEGRAILAPAADIAASAGLPLAETELSALNTLRGKVAESVGADISAERAAIPKAPLGADVAAVPGAEITGTRGAQIAAEEGLIPSTVLEPRPQRGPAILQTKLPGRPGIFEAEAEAFALGADPDPIPGGGARPPAGPADPSVPQRIHKLHNQLARDWDLERLGPEVLNPEDVVPIAKQRVIAEFGDDPTITLYRGIGPGERQPAFGAREGIGEFWSTNPNRAAGFARGGKIYRVEVKASELANPVGTPRPVGVRATKAGDEFVLPPEITARAEPQLAPSGGRRGPPGKPPSGKPRGPSPDDPQFDRIQEVAIKGEKPAITLLRRHEGAINTAKIEARIQTEEGNALLRSAKMGQSFKGTVIPKLNQIDEFDELFRLLHNPSKVRSGALTVPGRLRPIYNKLRDLTDWEQAARLDFDPEMALVEDYFFRGWKPPEGMFAGGAPARGGLGRQAGFKLPRVNATFEEMRAAGFEPLFWNPFEQWRFSRMMGVRYREQMSLIENVKGLGLAHPDAGGIIPKGWRVPRVGPAFEGKPFGITDAAGSPRPMFTRRWIVPDTLADRLENAYGVTPQLGTVEVFGKAANLAKAVDAVVFLPKRAKLLGSVFQHVDFLTRSHIGAWTGFTNALRQGQPINAVKHLAKWPQSAGTILRASVSPGYRQTLRHMALDTTPLVPSRPGVTMRSVTEAGLGLRDVTILPSNIDDIAREASQEAIAAGVIKSPGRALAGLERVTRQNLFQGVYPAAILTDVRNNIAPIMVRNYPNLNDAQLAAQIAKAASIKYSTIPGSISVVQNRFVRNVLTRVFFSLSENEGLLRQATGALAGPQAAFWRDHWLGAYVGLLAAANVIHFASTGEPLPMARYSPIAATKFGPLPFGYNRDFAAPNIPLTGRSGTQITLDLVGQLDTAFRILDPAGFISARESVPVRSAANQITGTDFFGAPIDEVGPGGIVSRTSQLIFDMFAPIGVGQAGLELARSNIEGAESIIRPGEDRLGTAGTAVQATGVNLRAETTPQLLDRIRADVMRELGVEGTYAELKRTGSTVAIDDEVERRIGRELDLRGETAKLRGQTTPAGQLFREAERIRGEFTAAQLQDDAAFNAGTMEASVWKREQGDRAAELFFRRDAVQQFLEVEFERDAAPGSVRAAVNNYFDVDAAEFRDPSTGEYEWDVFFAEQDKQLAPLSPTERREALEIIRKNLTPTQIEFKDAQDVRTELENTPRFRGMTVTEWDELQDFYARVDDARSFWSEQHGADVSVADAIRTLAERDGKGPNFTQWAILLRAGTRTREELRNPEWDEFLQEHEAELRTFFPELYESRRIQEQLFEARQPAGVP